MQRNIDSFFKRVPAKKKSEEETKLPEQKKRRARALSSDEEEAVVHESPQAKNNKRSRTEQITPKIESNSGKKSSLSKLKNVPKPELKKVDPLALFGGEAKRVEAKRPPTPKEKGVIELEDEDINHSLMEIDLDASVSEQHSKKENGHKEQIKPKLNGKIPEVRQPMLWSPKKPDSPKKVKPAEATLPKKQVTPKSEKPMTKKSTPHTKKAKEHADLESSVLSDEERHERKRMAAVLYQKYKNRSSCINHGCKEVPKGKPDCLKGLTFLVTGVLESIERDEASSIIKEYGGRTMTVVGKKLNYLIVGEDSGPKKLAQAEEFNITILSEDGFFDLIRERSGEVVKPKDMDTDEKPSTSIKNKQSAKKTVIKDEVEEIVVKKPKFSLPKVKQELKVSPASEKKHTSKEESNNISPVKMKTEPAAVEIMTPADTEMLSWVDKYKPTSVKDIIGQQGAASNVQKLMNWLSKWYINHDGKKKLQKPNPWAKNDDGSFYKAALLSGPPGIGKTTTATLVCKELGFDTVELNASDTRSKRLLKEEIAELLSNKTLYGYCHGASQAVSKKHVLLMDEVDGMAGNEDRGGIQELIALIKDSSVPIICMCNDRNHQKMRSLVNYCYDLRFNRPRVEQIKGRIMSICFKEKVKMEPAKIEEIIAATNNDIRQSINHISLLSAGKNANLNMDNNVKTAQKDLKIGPWEVVRKVFSADEHKRMNLNDKCDLFFHDYSMAPLFVQQNYLQVTPTGPKKDILRKVVATAESLAIGDMVDQRIRANSAWSLLPTQAIFSSVLPGEYMSGHFTGQINFPGWLGKYSRANRRSRLAQEIHDHTRICTSGSKLSVRLDYAPILLQSIVRPLRERGVDGVPEALEVIKEYHLLREDIDSLIELSAWPGQKNPMDAVDGRVKAALTRAFNKEVLAYTYSAQAGVKKKRAEADDEVLGLAGEEEGEGAIVESDEDDKNDLENDGLIKAKKKITPAAAKRSSAKAAASTSKPKGSNGKAKK